MSDKRKDSTEKSIRILKILKRLSKGEIINIEKVSNEYNVHRKTVQRDIESLRAYFLEENSSEIKYSKTKKGYYLINNDQNNFTNEETLAISKIILESRAFNKTELEKLLKKLIKQATNEDRKIIEDIIKNEEFNYSPLQHGKNLLSIIWDLSQYIVNKELINIKYTTKDGVQKNYEAKSLSIMFSEYYFYLITYVNGKEEYPAILRIDRISEIKRKNQKFLLPYNERFEDGKSRKYVSFMHSGPVNIEVEKESDEEKLKNLAIKFIEEMSGEKLNERKVKIERQYVMSGEDEKGKSRKYIIDILLGIKNKENDGIVDKYIIIEDKTFTGVHGDQINKYREYLAKEKNK
ncbi:helix-turn-helix transcriptional regulator [Pseudoleptotrichia goodfellowii]|nr:WYL domain-containing protein [Pseudoleptotrichia goodfellowii]